MRRQALTAAVVAVALAACRGPAGEVVPPDAPDANTSGNAAATGPTSAPGPATARDGRQFVELAAAGDMYAIEAARLASEKARHAGIRALAQAMQDDHRRSAGALERAAGAADPAIPFAPTLSAFQLESIEALRAAPAEGFDRAFLGQQLEAQQRMLTLYTDYAVNGDVDALRRHASESADPLQRHLSRTRDLIVEIPFE